MQPEAALNSTELNQLQSRVLAEASRSTDKYFLDGEEIGGRKQDFKTLSRINNGTVLINGTRYPSVQVSLTPIDPETSCTGQLDFSWEALDYTREELTIQLDFTTPTCVSGTSNSGDTLRITFLD